MTHEHYVAGVAPDWTLVAHRFSPLTHTDPQRRRPMAVRRTSTPRNVERLKARWFAIGCVAGWLPLVIVYVAVRLLGGA